MYIHYFWVSLVHPDVSHAHPTSSCHWCLPAAKSVGWVFTSRYFLFSFTVIIVKLPYLKYLLIDLPLPPPSYPYIPITWFWSSLITFYQNANFTKPDPMVCCYQITLFPQITGTTGFLVTYPFSALVISTLSSSVICSWMSSCTFFFAQYLIYLSVFLFLFDVHPFKVIFP